MSSRIPSSVACDADPPAELLQHVDAGPSVRRVHHEVHRAAGRQHVAQGPQARVGVGEMMEHAGADDLIEGRPQLADALDGELADLEIVELVLSLELLGVADAGRAEVDARHPGRRPAQGVLGRLRGPAAGDQDRVVLAVGLRGPEQMIVGAAPAAGPARGADSSRGCRRAADRDAARRRRAPSPRRHPHPRRAPGATGGGPVTCRITASRLNEAGFWRGGNFAKSSICAATSACISYSMKA